MPPNPLDTPATPDRLHTLVQTNHLTASALEYALYRIGVLPDSQAWQRFLDKLGLFIGSALVLAGIIFFFAYNWVEMDRLTKFTLLEISLFGLALFALWRLDDLVGKISLLATAVVLGVLLAVYGQIYQTGADAFNLFLTWAILIIPWVLVGTFAPLWFLLIILLNLSLILYWAQVINPSSFYQNIYLFLMLFSLNGGALGVWEYAYKRQVTWLQGNWFGRILFAFTLTCLIIPTIYAIIEAGLEIPAEPLFAIVTALYVTITGLALWYYQIMRRDLALIAANLLGIILVLTVLCGKLLPLGEMISWLILALIIMGQATLATKWLQRIA